MAVNSNVFTSLLRDKNIKYGSLTIYPPTLNDIFDGEYGYEMYMNLMLPYSMTLDFLEIKDENVKLFSDIFLGSREYLLMLFLSLQMLTKCDDVMLKTEEDKKPFLKLIFKGDTEEDNKYFDLTDDNFDEFAEIVRTINFSSKFERETAPEGLSKKQKEVWTKLKKGRARDNQKNAIKICDVINICEFGGKFHIPSDIYNKWTLWKLYKCHENITNNRNYDDGMQIACVSGDSEQISGENHWYKRMIVHDK